MLRVLDKLTGNPKLLVNESVEKPNGSFVKTEESFFAPTKSRAVVKCASDFVTAKKTPV